MDLSLTISKIKNAEGDYVFSFDKSEKVYSFINPYGYHLLRKNADLYKQLDGLWVDGMLMCLFIRFFYGIKVTRRSFDMTTVAKDLFNRLQNSNETIYFIGASQNEIENTIALINQDYPRMNIAGYRNGFFSTMNERAECYAEIIRKNPNFVVVGMGAVLQEKFIIELKERGYKGISFTCGGYIRQASKGLNYFPKWVERYHLRAFYRLYKEKGMFKRLYNVLIEFPILFIFDVIVTEGKE